jgi:hypothetical protein
LNHKINEIKNKIKCDKQIKEQIKDKNMINGKTLAVYACHNDA